MVGMEHIMKYCHESSRLKSDDGKCLAVRGVAFHREHAIVL